ncbi:MAG TPA: POTRA domain-containing protein [Candidatus Binatia bacterium]|nr:POTRA domain-containing protein [Candidatus Binatia bacterium]
MLNYKPAKNLNIQGIQSDSDLYTLGVQYQLSFHSARETAPAADVKVKKPKPLLIDNIQIDGEPVLTLPVIMKQIKQKPGRVFSFSQFQQDSEKLRSLYRENDYLSVKISAEYYPADGKVTLIYRIFAGAKVFLGFPGEGIHRSLRKKCAERWMEGQFDAARANNVMGELTQFFYRKKYYQAQVSFDRVVEEHRLFYFFSINKGMKFNRIEVDFTGNRHIPDNKILRELKKWRMDVQLFSDPDQVRKKIENYYTHMGFLNAQVSLPDVSLDPGKETAVVRFAIKENALFRVGKISFSGSTVLSERELLDLTRLKKDMPVARSLENDPVEIIEAHYRKNGFNQIQVSQKSVLTTASGRKDIVFTIVEGFQGVVQAIKIIGNKKTRESVILRELTFKVGDTIDFIQINKSRMKLYDLGIFALVDFEWLAAEESPQRFTDPTEATAERQKKYFQVLITVNESPDYHVKIGGQYDSDSKIAARVEAENRNLFGLGHSLGAGFQMNSKETDLRGYYRLPYLLFNKVNTIITAFSTKKEESLFSNSRLGLTLQQQVNFGKTSIFSLNYTREKTTFITNQDPNASPQRANVAHVTFGYFDDRRDNIFNPNKGFSLSASVQGATRFLGSDYAFIRYSGQFDFYLRAIPHLTWATSFSFGLVDAPGHNLSLAEKFFASGRGVIRGFTADEIGPVEAGTGKASGGDAILIFRQELRWQILSMISVAAFSDWGNVFVKSADFSITKLRKSAGIGVRFHFQPMLFRLDWGIKLDPRPGEGRSLFYFGIGHVF